MDKITKEDEYPLKRKKNSRKEKKSLLYINNFEKAFKISKKIEDLKKLFYNKNDKKKDKLAKDLKWSKKLTFEEDKLLQQIEDVYIK